MKICDLRRQERSAGCSAASWHALGAEVTSWSAGRTSRAIRERGLTLQADGTERGVFQVRATDKMAELGPQDLVIIGLKAHQVAGVAADVRGLVRTGDHGGDSTNRDPLVVLPQDRRAPPGHHPGIPWTRAGIIAKNIEVDRVLGVRSSPRRRTSSTRGDRPRRGRPAIARRGRRLATPSAYGTAKLLRDAGFKVRVSDGTCARRSG